MTIGIQRFHSSPGLLADEDVLPRMQRWQAEGLRTALVTLVGVEGGAPRQPGAQMAVTEDGRSAGYLSGGCLEQAVALEAQAVIAERRNRLVRYGKGSPYFDIKLPCGSGLDLYFDQALDPGHLASMDALRAARRPFALRTDLSSGASSVDAVPVEAPMTSSRRAGGVFERIYVPALQVLLLGNGPGLVGIAAMAAAIGVEVQIFSEDDSTRVALAQFGLGSPLDEAHLPAAIQRLDFASAAVLVFHEHEKEQGILSALLETGCFYIGVLGNHAVHRDRIKALAARGVSAENLRRLRAPVGSIPGAKSKATLAVGVLAEMITEAKALNLVS
jgi:xanthine dehydrogenase accessory factor